MADEKSTQQINPDDESKKDTVRINLPPGLAGKTAAPAAGGPSTVKLKPAAAPPTEDEAKKETAVMGRPAETPKPKSDTSRVQVAGAKAGAPPETPRPTVKLKQAEPPVAAKPAAPTPAPAQAAAPAAGGEISGALAGLSLAAMVMAIATAVYLAMLAM
jgi:hypothetical protein